MGCGCGKHKDGKATPRADAPGIAPTDPCVFCAEKHLATAYALAQESGYVPLNRARIIGELVASQWHLWRLSLPLAEKIRDVRHLVQHRKESEIDWAPLISEMDWQASREAAAST